MKKPGLDVMIAVAKPKPMKGGPAPLLGRKSEPEMEGEEVESEPEEDAMGEPVSRRLDRIEKMQSKIQQVLMKLAEANGVEMAEDEEDEY